MIVDGRINIMSPSDWRLNQGKIVAMDSWPKGRNSSPVIASGATAEELEKELVKIGRSLSNVVIQIVPTKDNYVYPCAVA